MRKKILLIATALLSLTFFILNIEKQPKYSEILLIEDHIFEPVNLSESSFDEVSSILLSNRTYLAKGLTNYQYIEDLPWNELSSTYNLYLHCLYDVHYLSILYDETGSEVYLEKAKEIVIDWFDYKDSINSEKDKYLWNDHAVSKRSLTLLHLLLLNEEKNNKILSKDFSFKLNELLKVQGDWLYKDENYALSNHGLMMDKSLLVLGLYYDESSWVEKAADRINSRIKKDFTSNGVHLENSTGYHTFVMSHYFEILDFFEYYNLTNLLDYETTDLISKMPEYLVYITMPNGYLPRIGDTDNQRVSTSYENPKLEYLISEGERGVEPEAGLTFLKDAGVATFRESWDKDKMKKSVWWSMKSGTNNYVHKQDDDLSFMIYSSGNEILSDSGKFNYERDNIFRQYALSPMGHNSISINNERYNAEKNPGRIGYLQMKKQTNKYIWLSAENRAYEKCYIIRDFIFFNPNTFFIIDRVNSESSNKYSQHFLLGPNMKFTSISDMDFTAISHDKKSTIELKQYNNFESFETYRADETTGKGYIFEQFEEKTPIDYIEYIESGDEATYLTSIQLNKNYFKNIINSAKINSNVVTIYINNQRYLFELDDF